MHSVVDEKLQVNTILCWFIAFKLTVRVKEVCRHLLLQTPFSGAQIFVLCSLFFTVWYKYNKGYGKCSLLANISQSENIGNLSEQ